VDGLEGLSIGRLATELEMSKSGVYAHFRSKEQLQLATIENALETFGREVTSPAMEANSAIDQISGICELFLSYLERRVFPGGCFFVTVTAEFDARPGPVRESVVEAQRDWMAFLAHLAQAAKDEGSLRADLDPAQLAFELNAFLETADLLYMMLDEPDIMERTRTAITTAIERARAAN
jgi:AcrR family transcriptional regulator